MHMHRETRQAALPASGQRRGLSIIRKPGNEPGQAPVGKEQIPIAEVCSPRGCPKDGAVPGTNPAFAYCDAKLPAPSRCDAGTRSSRREVRVSPLPSARAPPSLGPPQRGGRQQPSRCMCFAGACLANEKLLWIPLWAFQEGLARFLQSRHGETVCFSKYVRDFSGAWLWQGLSAVVSSCLLARADK